MGSQACALEAGAPRRPKAAFRATPFPTSMGQSVQKFRSFLRGTAQCGVYSILPDGRVCVTSKSILFLSKHVSLCLFLTTALQYLHSATHSWKPQRTTELALHKCLWTGHSRMGDALPFHSPSRAGLPVTQSLCTYGASTACALLTVLPGFLIPKEILFQFSHLVMVQ